MATKTAMITIAGRPNVGKSTLTNYLVGEKIAIVSNKPQTTRNRICGIVTKEDTQFVFVDTPGFHKPRTKLGDYMVNVTKGSIADVDLTVMMVEPIASIGPQEQGLIEQLKATHCPVVLAINKIDSVEKDILLEVNIGDEESKGGAAIDEIMALARHAMECPHLNLRGIMCIPPATASDEENRAFFQETYQLFVDMKEKLGDNNPNIDCLSMGMSGDYPLAIEGGSTMVRVGTALFGARPPWHPQG